MPMQQQMPSIAAKLGGKFSAALAEHRGKPIDTGNRRLPAGIHNGIARLSSMYFKEYEDDKNGPGTKGQVFFRASAVVMSPAEVAGEKVAGMVTSVVIPICDMPEKGKRKAVSLKDNTFKFQNLFRQLGVELPNVDSVTDPTGQQANDYYVAAMGMLCDPHRAQGPVYVSFTTRGFTPPATPQQPKPEEIVMETWHGFASPEDVAALNAAYDPTAGINFSSVLYPQAVANPPPFQEPPRGVIDPLSQRAVEVQANEESNTSSNGEETYDDIADEVGALLEVLLDDPDNDTEDSADAAARMEELAWAAGWTREQTTAAADWEAVAEMALNPPGVSVDPVVGSRWRFSKRTKDGNKLRNKDGEFPAVEVEVMTVDNANKTCTVKTVKDDKDVVDLRSKKPTEVKWEWLE